MATKRKEPESQRISWFLYSFELPLLCISAKRYSIAGRISAASCSSHSCSINNSFCFFTPSVAKSRDTVIESKDKKIKKLEEEIRQLKLELQTLRGQVYDSR